MNGRARDAASIRECLVTAIKCSQKDREQIASEMSAMLGTRVTERMITAFTAESKEMHRWPAEFDIAFCEVTGNWSLLEERAERAGFHLADAEEQRLIAIGRAYLQKAKADAVLSQAWRDEVVKL